MNAFISRNTSASFEKKDVMIGKRQTDYLCARQALECLRLSAEGLFFTSLKFGQLLWAIVDSRRGRVGQSENI
jgi:hypothetical protein